MIRVGIVGASGYTGQECVRLLATHPDCEIVSLFANTLAGTSTHTLFNQEQNIPTTFEKFDSKKNYEIDCLFLAVPHTTVHPLMNDISKHSYKVIDLSADFRLSSEDSYNMTYNQHHESAHLLENFVYGIPELYYDRIKSAHYVSNPGCFAIASILALFPLASKNLINNAIIDAKTGVSGAGKTVIDNLLYCEVNEQIRAYKTNKHRHSVEIRQACGIDVLFSPHLVPMQRGILASCYITCTSTLTKNECLNLYQSCYLNQPFILIQEDNPMPSTKNVVRSNSCELSIVETHGNSFVIFSAIDNLVKGSAGNAIQCMNIMFGLNQKLGIAKIAERI